MKDKIIKFFKFVTNNNRASEHHELEFDITFFIIITIALITGIVLLAIKQMLEWSPFLIIEYIWCLDNLRHNY